MVLEYDLSEYTPPHPLGKSSQGTSQGSKPPFIVNPPHKISVEYRYSGSGADKSSVRAITYVPEDQQLKKASTDDVTLSITDKTTIPSLPSMDQPRHRRRATDDTKGSGSGGGRGRSKTPSQGEREEEKRNQKEMANGEKKQHRSRSRSSPSKSKTMTSRSGSKTSAVAGESFRSAVDLSSSQRSYPSQQTANNPNLQTSPATSELPQQPLVLSPLISQTDDAPEEESGMTTAEVTAPTMTSPSPPPPAPPPAASQAAAQAQGPLKPSSASHRRALLSFRRRSACGKQGRGGAMSPLTSLSPKSQKQRNVNGGKQKKAGSPASNQLSAPTSSVPTSRRTQPRTTSFDPSALHNRHQVHALSAPNQPQPGRKPGGGNQAMTEQHLKTNQSPATTVTNDPQTSQTTDPSQGNVENQPPAHKENMEIAADVKKCSGIRKQVDLPHGHSKHICRQRSRHHHHHKHQDHQEVKGKQPPLQSPEQPTPATPQPQRDLQRQLEMLKQQADSLKYHETQLQQIFQQQTLPTQSFPQVQLFPMTQKTHVFQPPQQQQQQNLNYQPIQNHPPLQQPQLQQQTQMQQSQALKINQMFQQPQIPPVPQTKPDPPTYQQPKQPPPQMYQQHPIFQPPQTHQHPQLHQQPQLSHQHPELHQQPQLSHQPEVYPQQTQPHQIPPQQQGFPQPCGFHPKIPAFQQNQQMNSPLTKEKTQTLESLSQVDTTQIDQKRWRSASKMRPPQPVSLPDLSEPKGRTRSESRGPVSDLSLDGIRHTETRSRSMVNGKFDGTNSQVGPRVNMDAKAYLSQKGDFGRPSSPTQQMSKLQRAVQYAATIPRPILKPQRRKRKMGTPLSPHGSSQLKAVEKSGDIIQQGEAQKVSQPAKEGLPSPCLLLNQAPNPSLTPATIILPPQTLPSFFPFPSTSPTLSQQASSINFSATSSRQFSSGYSSQTNFQSAHTLQQSPTDHMFSPNYQFSHVCPHSGQVQHSHVCPHSGQVQHSHTCPQSGQVQHSHTCPQSGQLQHPYELSAIHSPTPFALTKASHHQIDITVSVPSSSAHPEPQGKLHSEPQQPIDKHQYDFRQQPTCQPTDKHQYDFQCEHSRNTFSKMSDPKQQSETKLEFNFSPSAKSHTSHHNLHGVPSVMRHATQAPSAFASRSSSKTSIAAINIAAAKHDSRSDASPPPPQRNADFAPMLFHSPQSRNSRDADVVDQRRGENNINPFANKFPAVGFPKSGGGCCGHGGPPFARCHPFGHPGPFNQLRMGLRRQPTLDRISSVSTTAGNTPDDAKTANDVSEGEFAMKEEGSVSKEMTDKRDECPTKVDSDIFGPNENGCIEGESSGKDTFAPEQKRHLVTRSSRLYGGKSSSPEGSPPWSPRTRRLMESRLPIPRRYLGSSSLASNEEGPSCRSGTEQTEDEYHVSVREKATSVRFGSSSTQMSRSSRPSAHPSPSPSAQPPPSHPSPLAAAGRRSGPPCLSPLVAARRQRLAQQRTLSVSVTSVEGDAEEQPKRRMRTETAKKLDALQRSQIARQSPSKPTRPPNYHPVLQPIEDRLHKQQQQQPAAAQTPGSSASSYPSSTPRPPQPHSVLNGGADARGGRFTSSSRPEVLGSVLALGGCSSPSTVLTKAAKHHPPGLQSLHHPDDVATPPHRGRGGAAGAIAGRGGGGGGGCHVGQHPTARCGGGGGGNSGDAKPLQQQQHRSAPTTITAASATTALGGGGSGKGKAAAGATGRESEATHDAMIDSRTNLLRNRFETETKDVMEAAPSSVSEMPEESVVTIVENPEERKNQQQSNPPSKDSDESKNDIFPPTAFLSMRKSIKNCIALVTAPGADSGCVPGSKDIIVMHHESSTSSPFMYTSSNDKIFDQMECPENDKPSLATTKRSSPVLWRKNDFGSAVTNLKKSNSTFLPSKPLFNCMKEPAKSSKSILNDLVLRPRAPPPPPPPKPKPSESRGFDSTSELSMKTSIPGHVTAKAAVAAAGGPDGYPLVNSSRAYLEQQFQLLQRNQFYQQKILEQQHQVLQQFQNCPIQETSGPPNEKLPCVKDSLPEDHTLQAVTSLDDDEEDVEERPPTPRRTDASSQGLAKTMRASRALRQAVKDMQLIQGRREKEGSRYSLIPRGAQTKIIDQTRKSSDLLRRRDSAYSAAATLPHLACVPCCRCVSRTVFSWRSSQSQPHVQHCSSHHIRQQQQHNLGCSSWHGAAWWANANIPSSPNSSSSITHKSTSSTLPRLQSTLSHGRFCHSSQHLGSKSVHPTITEPSIPSTNNRSDRWHVRWKPCSPETRSPRHFCSCSAVHRQHDAHKETYNTAGDAGLGSWSRHRLRPCVQTVAAHLHPRASPPPHKPSATTSAPPTRPPHHQAPSPSPPPHQPPSPSRARSVTGAHDVTHGLVSKPSAKRLKLSESKGRVKPVKSSRLRLKLSEPKIGMFGTVAPMRAFETNVDGVLTTSGSHNWRRLCRKDRVLLLQRFHRLERSAQLRQINVLHGSRHKLEQLPEVLDNSRFYPDGSVELRLDEYQRLMEMADDMARLHEKRARPSTTQLNTYFNTRPKTRTHSPPTPASPKMSATAAGAGAGNHHHHHQGGGGSVAASQQQPVNFEILHEAAKGGDECGVGDLGRKGGGGAVSDKSSRERRLQAKKAKKKKRRTKSAATVTRSVCSKATSRSSYKRSRERGVFFNKQDGGGSPTRNSAPSSTKSPRTGRRRQRSNPEKSPKR